MKPLNVQNIDKYPENYDDITDTQVILAYMNAMQGLAERYYQKYMTNPSSEEYWNLYQHTLTSLTGSKNAYATLGIMVEYGWKNHLHEWFLATRQDAIDYAESADEEAGFENINELISELLDYTDVGQ